MQIPGIVRKGIKGKLDDLGFGNLNKYYKEKLDQGLMYQDFVVEKLYDHGLPIISYSSKKYQIMIGENKAGLEIKNDDKFRNTGNFYIEIAEKSNPQKPHYVMSGIYRNDNTWLYLIGDYQDIYIFGKKHLIQMHQTGLYRKVEIPTSKGFLLPLSDAEKYAVKIINCEAKNEGKVNYS